MQTEPGETPLQYVSRDGALVVGDLDKQIVPIGGHRIEGVAQKADDNQAAAFVDALVNAQQFVVCAINEKRILWEILHGRDQLASTLGQLLLLDIGEGIEQLIDKLETDANDPQQGRGKDNVSGGQTVLNGIEGNQDVGGGRDGALDGVEAQYHDVCLAADNHHQKLDREVAIVAEDNVKLTTHLPVQLEDLVHDLQHALRIASAN